MLPIQGVLIYLLQNWWRQWKSKSSTWFSYSLDWRWWRSIECVCSVIEEIGFDVVKEDPRKDCT